MKNTHILALFAALSLTACSKNNLPEACVELLEITKEFAASANANINAEAQEKMLEKLENRWEAMTDEQKERTRKECEQTKEMLEAVKALSN